MPKELRAASYMQRAAPVVLPSDYTPSSRSSSAWTAEEDDILMNARAAGLNWKPIASRHFPNKTDNACRKRHERLMAQRNAEDWDGPKLELLAKEYMNVRREMWTLLANRVGGEKWQLIEAKCMEKGLKNLQAVHRSAQRRERGMDGDESRIGFSDAEHDIIDDDPPQMSLQQFHQMQQQYHQNQLQQQRHRPQGGRLSIQAMLSPSPSA
ncbi:hypothetical protein NA57DRAFT_81165 [Rhizodiscina lignyota]|uniref:Myb-like domain-containing protein n=1 Tax=Rhizodiscina lignyota TaxID=1504668 RepID=A0A9P4I2A1_9PEZI|nr:hypothetical protein NA57DRAFT_81165 [Rhizodiscina lignyota]